MYCILQQNENIVSCRDPLSSDETMKASRPGSLHSVAERLEYFLKEERKHSSPHINTGHSTEPPTFDPHDELVLSTSSLGLGQILPNLLNASGNFGPIKMIQILTTSL